VDLRFLPAELASSTHLCRHRGSQGQVVVSSLDERNLVLAADAVLRAGGSCVRVGAGAGGSERR
jgi:hypothetical protein